jgi:hypothetical protein
MKVLACLVLIVLAQNGPPNTVAQQPATATAQRGRGEERASKDAPTRVAVFPSQTVQLHADKKEQEEAAHAENERETFWAALGMFLLTGVVAYYAYGLFSETRLASQRQLRAYVSVTFADVFSDDATDVPDGYTVSAINHGQTPALQCSVSLQMQSLKRTDIDTFAFPERLDDDPTGDLVLNKDAPRTFRSKAVTPKMDKAEWEAITEGDEKRLYCWGIARYTDVFGRRHWARYCFYQGGKLVFDTTSEMLPQRRTPYCHRHNDTSDAVDARLNAPADVQPGLAHKRSSSR